MHGSYEALKAGFAADALEDFTAGIVETYYLRSNAPMGVEPAPQHLYQLLLQASQEGALICAGIMVKILISILILILMNEILVLNSTQIYSFC